MITERGRVVAIESDSLWVETIRQSTCQSCSAQKGCGHGLLNQISNKQRHHVRVLLAAFSATEFEINDEVEISIPEQILVSGALMVYILPLISMLIGAGLATQFWPSDITAVAGAVVGFVSGISVVRYHAQINRGNDQLQPKVTSKLAANTQYPTKAIHLADPL